MLYEIIAKIMKKIRLKLTIEQQILLGGALMEMSQMSSIPRYYPTEYYVLIEWYLSNVRRFAFCVERPFLLRYSQARALWWLARVPLWGEDEKNLATAILWQLDKYFEDSQRNKK
jgi:hypothetical protein